MLGYGQSRETVILRAIWCAMHGTQHLDASTSSDRAIGRASTVITDVTD